MPSAPRQQQRGKRPGAPDGIGGKGKKSTRKSKKK